MPPNKIFYAPANIVSFKETAGDVVFTPKNILNAEGRRSAQHDFGTGAQPRLFRWRAKSKVQAVATPGRMLRIFGISSDGTIVDGGHATTDATLTDQDRLWNLKYIGSLNADDEASNILQGSGAFDWAFRYMQVVWWNDTGQQLTNVAGDHEFIVEEIPDEIQA